MSSSAKTALAYRTLTPAALATEPASRVLSAKRASITARNSTRTSERDGEVRDPSCPIVRPTTG